MTKVNYFFFFLAAFFFVVFLAAFFFAAFFFAVTGMFDSSIVCLGRTTEVTPQNNDTMNYLFFDLQLSLDIGKRGFWAKRIKAPFLKGQMHFRSGDAICARPGAILRALRIFGRITPRRAD